MKHENAEKKPCRRVRKDVIGGNVVDIIEYSSQDIDSILEGWGNVYKNGIELGLEAFKNLFYDNPKYLTFFSESLDVEHLDEDEFFVAHTRAVMRGINMAMDNLTGAYEEANEVLPMIAHTHHKREITAEMMTNLKTSLLNTFSRFLQLNKTERETWETVMDFIFNNYIIKYIPEVIEAPVIPTSPSVSKLSSETN